MNVFKALRFAALLGALASCAHSSEPRREEAPPPPKLPEMTPGSPRRALLVLYRPFEGSYSGSGFATVHLWFDGMEIGELGTNDIALLEASPGDHAVAIRSAFGDHAVTWGAVGAFTRYLVIDTEGGSGPHLRIKESEEARRAMEGMSIKLRKVFAPPNPI